VFRRTSSTPPLKPSLTAWHLTRAICGLGQPDAGNITISGLSGFFFLEENKEKNSIVFNDICRFKTKTHPKETRFLFAVG
jgi:hypothetical protein